MAIGLVLAFGEEIAVRGLILDRLERCGSSRLLQVVITAAVMGVYHGVGGGPPLHFYGKMNIILINLDSLGLL